MGGIDKKLQPGQIVRCEELESGCRIITVLPPHEAGLKVTDVGHDFVVVHDAAEGVKTRIPVHCIKSIHVPEGAADTQAA